MKAKILIFSIIVVGAIVLVEERSGQLSEGEKAPQFSLRASNGHLYSLDNLLGEKSVVLFFYPKDFTRGCTEQVCALRDKYAEILELGAVLLGVSPDDSLSHERFIEANNLPFPLLVDKGDSVMRAYGVMRLGGLLPPKRVTYVVDQRGIIRRAIHEEFRTTKHVSETIDALKRLSDVSYGVE